MPLPVVAAKTPPAAATALLSSRLGLVKRPCLRRWLQRRRQRGWEFAKLSSDSETGNEKKLQCCRSRTEVRPTALPSSPTLQAVTPTRYLDGQSPTSCCNDPGTCPCRWSPRSPRPGARRSSRCPEAHLPPPARATPVVPRGPDRRGAAGSAWVATRRTPSTAAGHPTASSPCRVMQQNSVNFTLSTLSYIILKIYSAPITKWT